MKIRLSNLFLLLLVSGVFSPAAAETPAFETSDVEKPAESGKASEPYSGQVSVNSVLATVDGEPVTLLDVVRESGREEWELAGTYSGERLNTETLKLRRRVLEEIILRKLVFREYKREPFEIPKQMIEAVLDRQAEHSGGISRAELEKKARETGSGPAGLRRQAHEALAVDIMLFRNCDQRVSVTPKDVYEEYQAHPEEWTNPGRIDFQMIQLNREGGRAGADWKAAAAKIAAEIKNADEVRFTRLVADCSDGANREKNGFVLDAELPKLRPEFQNALKDLKPGGIAGPVETPEAVFFLRVSGVRNATVIPFEKAAGKIYDRLMKREIRKKRAEYEKRLREKALIQYYI